jgi:glycine cleavage system pyridoxal-binding protein P
VAATAAAATPAAAALQVSLYNTPGLQQVAEYGHNRAFTLAQQLFPKGQAVAIIEPYYKLATDGTFLVRVDNPAEVGAMQLTQP